MKIEDIGLVLDHRLSPVPWAGLEVVQLEDCPPELWFGTIPTDIGQITVVGSGNDLCYLGFEKNRSIEKCLKFYPQSTLVEDQERAEQMVDQIIKIWSGKKSKKLRLLVKGTEFQIKVWDSLMRIPTGHVVSYSTVAEHIGHPQAVRAVGTAVGTNPISLLIPCHRVVQRSGRVENYGWGDAMKQSLLAQEAA